MNVNLDLVKSILEVFAALPVETPVEIDEKDIETMRHVLEHGRLPGESPPRPVTITGYPQAMVEQTILALEAQEILEVVRGENAWGEVEWSKPGGLTALGQELLWELSDPATKAKIEEVFRAEGDVPYERLIPVWYQGHHAALRQLRMNRQAWVAVMLLIVFLLTIIGRLLR
jgi:hypothetical protein